MKERKNEINTVETITISRSEYDAQKEQIAELNQKVDWLMEQLRPLRKKQFGTSSEQTKEQLDGQLSLLFNEAEAYTYGAEWLSNTCRLAFALLRHVARIFLDVSQTESGASLAAFRHSHIIFWQSNVRSLIDAIMV